MVLFLGTDATLETAEFSSEAPAFYVGVPRSEESPVRQHFITSQFYRLGLHTMCGCGFGYGQDPEWYAWAAELPDEANLNPDPKESVSRRQLAEFLRSLINPCHTAEVYARWSGDEAEPPDHRSELLPEAVLNPSVVHERLHILVTNRL